MPDSVVERVADRLEIQPEQTDQVLRTLAQLIKKQSARDGQVRVPGLGVFQQSTDTLAFEPDAALAEAINGRYAGLESVPLTLAPEPETTLDETPVEPAETEAAPEEPVVEAEPVVEDDIEEEPVAEEAEAPGTVPLYDGDLESDDFGEADLSEAGELPPEFLDELEEETEPDVAPPVTGWSKKDLDSLLKEGEAETAETDALLDEVEEEDEEADAFLDTLAEDSDDLPPPLPPGPKLRKPAKAPPRRQVLPWVMVAAAVLIIAAALLYQFGFFSPSPTDPASPPIATQTPPTETPDPATTDPATPDPQTTDPETPPPTGETETPTETPAETPPPETPAPTPPAASGSIDRAQGGYTLVVASFLQRADAEAEAERYRQRLNDSSIPVDVIQGNDSGGRVRYRVAIGQVPTTEEAVALRTRLSASLPSDAWPTRITPDS